MASSPSTIGALSTKVMLDRVFNYRNRFKNPLVDSGFLNTSNYFTVPAAGGLVYQSRSNQGAEIIGCVRGKPAYGVKAANFYSVDIPSYSVNSPTVAYFPVSPYLSETSGTGSITTAVGETIQFVDLIGAGGNIINQTVMETRLSNAIQAHFVGLEQTILSEIIQRIDDPVNIKTYNDNENPYGATKTYAQDVTTLRPVASQVVDLSSTTLTTDKKQLELRLELANLFKDFPLSGSKVGFLLLPEIAFEVYRTYLDPVNRGQYLYKGVTETDGTTPSYGSSFFTSGNIVIVGLPDAWFKKNNTKYRSYAMPSSAIAVYHPMIPTYTSVMFGDQNMLSDVALQNRLAGAGIGIEPNHFNIARDSVTSDPILEAMVSRSGGHIDAFSTNTIRLLMSQNPLGSAGSLDLRMTLTSSLSVLRTQPQYIQEWEIDPALLIGAAPAP